MGRSTVYNNITSPELLNDVLPDNLDLSKDFLEYLQSIDRSPSTVNQYKNDLNIFWVWNLQFNNNKLFTKVTKREFARFQNHCLNEWKWSSNRVRRVKSVLSSLSNFIENILDEEEEFAGYRSVIKKIESPVKDFVREKTVLEDDEVKLLLDTLVDRGEIMKAAVVALAAYSGARKSELPRFKLSYFDKENVIYGSLYKTPEKIKTKGRGKGKFINLYTLKNEFDPYLNLWIKERENLGIECEWLFPDVGMIGKSNVIEDPLRVSTMDNWVDEFSKIVNKPWYWHLNRHYRTTLLLKKNIPSQVVQDITGWQSLEMVSNYSDITTDENLGMYFDENGIKDIKPGGFN